MAEISHSSVEGNPGARAGEQLAQITNSQKTGILLGSLGVSNLTTLPGSPGAPVVHRLSTTTVDNLIGVWELELNALAVQRCSLRVVQILSLLVQPLPQLVLRF